jgi:phosphotransferase system HPr (HPr) family protein
MSDDVVSRTLVVTDPVGVHVRTAAAIAKIVRQSQSRVTLIKEDQDQRVTETTETLQIMTLAAEPGDSVRVEAVGPDAVAVLDAIEPLLAGDFGDEGQQSI